MTIFNTLSAGGQTWAHRMRMLRQVLIMAFTVSIVISVLAFIYFSKGFSYRDVISLYYYAKAISIQTLSSTGLLDGYVGLDTDWWGYISGRGYQASEIKLLAAEVIRQCAPVCENAWQILISNFSLAISSFIYTFIGVLVFFFLRGRLVEKTKLLEGGQVVNAKILAFKLISTLRASKIKIGGVPLCKGTETQHILVSGGTGSGKTQCFFHILPQIRKLGQKAVIIDTNGVYAKRYYREGKDIILDPFDDRSSAWHPWAEMKDLVDSDSIAESFVPPSNRDSEAFWRTASKSVLSAVLKKTDKEKSISSLLKILMEVPLKDLAEYLEGTKAAAHVDISSERTASSIRSVLASYIEPLEHLKDSADVFSIKDWFKKDDDSWLFLKTDPANRSMVVPLLSAWFSIAMKGLFDLGVSYDRRVWFIADELQALQYLPKLEQFAVEARQYGGCGLFAIQSPSQIESKYGHQPALTILGNLSTKVVFSEKEPINAKRISSMFGGVEVEETQEGLSYGANQIRDGVSLSSRKIEKALISASKIQALKKMRAYIKLANSTDVAKIKVKLQK